MKRKSTIWIAALLLLVAAFFIKIAFTKSTGSDKKTSKDKAQKLVTGYIATPSLLINEISVSGSLLAYDEVELKNEVSGRVVILNLPEGKVVTKGTLLVKLFDDDLQAVLKKLEAQLAVQEQIYKRQSELQKVNGISQNDYDQTGLQLNTLRADILVEKTLIRKTEVRAPFDGVIGLRTISLGAVVTPSTLLATIRSSDKIKLDFSVPEKYSSLITQGMKVVFTTNEANEQFRATVFATEKGIESSTRNLKVRAIVNSTSVRLIPGAYANVTLRLSENKKALLIPSNAIIPQEDSKNIIVARAGKAHFVKVKTGIRQATNVEILDGIQFGDTIITTGIQFLKEDGILHYTTISSTL